MTSNQTAGDTRALTSTTQRMCPLTFLSGLLGIHLTATDVVLSHNTVCFSDRRRGSLLTRLLRNGRESNMTVTIKTC